MESTDESDWKYLCDRRFAIKVRSLMNRLYQQERQRIMEMREGLVKAASLVAGSVAVAKVADEHIVAMCAAVICIGTASSLVFGWGNKARDAAKRAVEWTGLDRDVEAAGDRRFTEDDLDRWAARCNEIESGEPAPNKHLLEDCYRRTCAALNSPEPSGTPWTYWVKRLLPLTMVP